MDVHLPGEEKGSQMARLPLARAEGPAAPTDTGQAE